MPLLLELVATHAPSPDPARRRAVLLILAVTAAGCAEAFAKELPRLMPVVYAGCEAPEPRAGLPLALIWLPPAALRRLPAALILLPILLPRAPPPRAADRQLAAAAGASAAGTTARSSGIPPTSAASEVANGSRPFALYSALNSFRICSSMIATDWDALSGMATTSERFFFLTFCRVARSPSGAHANTF